MTRDQYPAALASAWLIARVIASLPFDEMLALVEQHAPSKPAVGPPAGTTKPNPFDQDRDCLEALRDCQLDLLERLPQLKALKVPL